MPATDELAFTPGDEKWHELRNHRGTSCNGGTMMDIYPRKDGVVSIALPSRAIFWLLCSLGRLVETDLWRDDSWYTQAEKRDIALLLHTFLRAAQKSMSPVLDDIATEAHELTGDLYHQMGYVPSESDTEAVDRLLTLLAPPQFGGPRQK